MFVFSILLMLIVNVFDMYFIMLIGLF